MNQKTTPDEKMDTDSVPPQNTPMPLRRKGIYVLPNLITLAALFGGFYAVVMSMNGRFDLATLGIFAAMILDSLDGRVARMTNTQSASFPSRGRYEGEGHFSAALGRPQELGGMDRESLRGNSPSTGT